MKFFRVFIAACALFVVVIPWHVFPDPDAFYHARIAEMISEHGPVYSFPWLDLTTLGAHFADQHFLFHVFEIPFIRGFGWQLGIRFSSIFFAALFLATFYVVVKRLGIRYASIWTLFLATTTQLVIRLSLGKASPVALTLFVLGMMFVWKRERWLLFALSVVYALTYGGWIIFLGSIGLLAAGDVLYRVAVEGESYIKCLRETYWQELMIAACGVVFGIFLHPNRVDLLYLLWIQVVQIGLVTSFDHVTLGTEWKPMPIVSLLSNFGVWLGAALLSVNGLLSARRLTLDREAARALIAFAFPLAAFVALTLKSMRNVEYLVPVVALWVPWLWHLFDPELFLRRQLEHFSYSSRVMIKIGGIVLVAMIVGRNIYQARSSLGRGQYSDMMYVEAMKPIIDKANEGDRVFHTDWDEFPKLFLITDRVRYVSGLDPTFLYAASSSLSDAVRDVTAGTPSSTALWAVAHDRIGARFVFVGKYDHAALYEVLEKDARFRKLADTPDAATYEMGE